MTRIGFMVFSLAAVCSMPVSAQVPSGGRDVFSVSDCAVPITLRFVGATKPTAIRTGDIAPRPAASPPGWTIEWDKPAAGEAAINEFGSLGRFKDGCPTPGLYSVPLTIYGEDGAGGAAQTLTVTVIRVVEPMLDVPASATLVAERVWGTPPAVPLLLRETVAGAPDTRVSVVGGELRTAAGEGTGVALEPGASSVVVKAGEIARVMLAPTQVLAPGSYTAKLALSGPAVRAGTTIEIVYKLRFVGWYLLLVLALGIGFGLLINGVLAGRAALDAALLSGLRAMQSLTRRASPQRDAAVQQRLLAVANLLQSNLEGATSPEAAAGFVTEAEAQAKEIETKATEAAAVLQQALATARGVFRPGGQGLDEQVALRLAAPLADLEQLQRAAEAGDVEQTIARLQDYSRDLAARALPLVRGFLSDAQVELAGLGALPEGGLATARDGLQAAIEDGYEGQDLAAMVRLADEVARRVRRWMDLEAPATLAAAWRRAAAVAPSALGQLLNSAAERADLLRRAGQDPLVRLGMLGDIARSVTAGVTKAATGKPEVLAALALGDAGAGPLEAQGWSLVGEVAPPAGPVAVLRLKPLIPLEQETVVVLRWMIQPPAPERVTWEFDPEAAGRVLAGGGGATVRPSQAGFLTVFLLLDGVRVADVRTYAGEVAEQGAYTVAAREGRWARLGIAVATAALTAFAGYEIFVPTWFGTVGDCFTAFLWGFFGQFGLDRVRELARPVLGRALAR